MLPAAEVGEKSIVLRKLSGVFRLFVKAYILAYYDSVHCTKITKLYTLNVFLSATASLRLLK